MAGDGLLQGDARLRSHLLEGLVIPAHPLALTGGRLDERRQRAPTRCYHAAGAGGLDVGVHTTQFATQVPQGVTRGSRLLPIQ